MGAPFDRKWRSPHVLTPREQAVAGLRDSGLSRDEVGIRLGISAETVAKMERDARAKIALAERIKQEEKG